jgi:hypothetical protein
MNAVVDGPTGSDSTEEPQRIVEDCVLRLTRSLLATLTRLFTEFATTDGQDPGAADIARLIARAAEIISDAFAGWTLEPTQDHSDEGQDADPDDEILEGFEYEPKDTDPGDGAQGEGKTLLLDGDDSLMWAFIEPQEGEILLAALELVLVELLQRERSPSRESMAAVCAATSQLAEAGDLLGRSASDQEIVVVQWLIRRTMELIRSCSAAAPLQTLVSAVVEPDPSPDGLGSGGPLVLVLSRADRRNLITEILQMIDLPAIKRHDAVPILQGLLAVLAERDLEVSLAQTATGAGL